ncbi:hypothetical protein MTR67_005486 [Solanum verrucosum]|uniref:U1-type domain-containing protein n=1 Tax=Solanum verrucosum TaxID=315347 RepID=A0AAF0Q0Y5_SOLVR|nr:hypothetical protein MTR67_005486 [Solanum verrucosum]
MQVVGVDNTSRKKFDREEILQRARERDEQEADGRKSKSKGPPVQRKPLKPRDYQVDLESRLGKTQVVTPIAPLSQQAGYYCPVCECVVKDSANYLDHINGKKHQRALGMSMRVERSSLEQGDNPGYKWAYIMNIPRDKACMGLMPHVLSISLMRFKAHMVVSGHFSAASPKGEFGVQQRFESLKKRKDPGSFTVQDFDERMLKQQQEEEERKRLRREKKKEKKKEKVSEEEPEIDPDVAAMMGFGGFKTSKK